MQQPKSILVVEITTLTERTLVAPSHTHRVSFKRHGVEVRTVDDKNATFIPYTNLEAVNTSVRELAAEPAPEAPHDEPGVPQIPEVE